jgi:integrase
MSRRGDSAVGQSRLVISEPKTTHSRREAPLHATTVAMLRKHRIAQMEERMAAANVWIDEGLVFTTETGGKVDPRNFLRVIEKAAATAKVEGVGVGVGVGVDTLRHFAATMWLESGIHIKQVADLLGHLRSTRTALRFGPKPTRRHSGTTAPPRACRWSGCTTPSTPPQRGCSTAAPRCLPRRSGQATIRR